MAVNYKPTGTWKGSVISQDTASSSQGPQHCQKSTPKTSPWNCVANWPKIATLVRFLPFGGDVQESDTYTIVENFNIHLTPPWIVTQIFPSASGELPRETFPNHMACGEAEKEKGRSTPFRRPFWSALSLCHCCCCCFHSLLLFFFHSLS